MIMADDGPRQMGGEFMNRGQVMVGGRQHLKSDWLGTDQMQFPAEITPFLAHTIDFAAHFFTAHRSYPLVDRHRHTIQDKLATFGKQLA